MKRLAAVLALLTAAAPALASSSTRPETAILRGASASAVLQVWCAARGLPPLAARRMDLAEPADPIVRDALAAEPGQIIRYRHVRLACGGHILSEADNWYLPGRLTEAMNRTLDTTDTPFGLVAQPLGFTRRTLGVRRSPDAAHRLEIRAVLVSSTGAPFSYVVEDYSPELDSKPGR